MDKLNTETLMELANVRIYHHFATTSAETSFLHRNFISGTTRNFVALIEANFTKVMHYGIYTWANAAKLRSHG